MTENVQKEKDTKPQELTVEYVLKNIRPGLDGKPIIMGCYVCAFHDILCDNTIACRTPIEYQTEYEENEIYWKKTPNCSHEFFNLLKKTPPETLRDITERALVKYLTYTEIGKLVSKNLTPYRCNNLYPECYSCHLGEYPDLCQMGCSCRNPKGEDFVNVVWHKKENFGKDNFLGVLGKYDAKDIKAAVQMVLSNLILENKLHNIK